MTDAEQILRSFKRIAVVGLSSDPARPSYGVASYMLDQGYEILPVNPTISTWRGRPAYPDLASVPGPLEVVDIFRRSEKAGAVIEEAVRLGAKAVWMQEGVIDRDAARLAREAGLLVVVDRCILKEHRLLIAGRGPQV